MRFGTPDADVATPVGTLCIWCEEFIGVRDRGYMEATLDAELRQSVEPIHIECRLRMVLGSVGHIEERCSCFRDVDAEEDPPRLSKREAALAAVAAYERKHGCRLAP